MRHYTREASRPFEFHAHRLTHSGKATQEMLVKICDLLFSVASADNTLSAEEEIIILQAESIFGTESPLYKSFREKRSERKHGVRRKYAESDCLRILGLTSSADVSEIRAKYRRLVMQYHPDRVQHLGVEFVKEAEVRIKEINMAYEYFRRKHAM